MYGIPNDLDLSTVRGEATTQICVGQFDLQCSFGPVDFLVKSEISLFKDQKLIGSWKEGKWPDPTFYEIMDVKIDKWEVPNDRLLVLHFENGIAMHLIDNSDQYECIEISIDRDSRKWII